jgi:hypothetical protein
MTLGFDESFHFFRHITAGFLFARRAIVVISQGNTPGQCLCVWGLVNFRRFDLLGSSQNSALQPIKLDFERINRAVRCFEKEICRLVGILPLQKEFLQAFAQLFLGLTISQKWSL